MNVSGKIDFNDVRVGQIIPIFKEINKLIPPEKFFSIVSDYGRKEHCLFFESGSFIEKYGEFSFGTADPCLKIKGVKNTFTIDALNDLGIKFIEFIKDDFSFCDSVEYFKGQIRGTLRPLKKKNITEDEKLKQKTHMDVLRTVAFAFGPSKKPPMPYGGLIGTISYDFIEQFEDLPETREDILNTPDYEMYFVDNLFCCDHKRNKTYFVANALVIDDDFQETFDQCEKTISTYEKILSQSQMPVKRIYGKKKVRITSDTSKKKYIDDIKKLKEHIYLGDIFQVVASRTLISEYNCEPLDIYNCLQKLNPSPYMFFVNASSGILLGASPEMALRVQGKEEKKVQIRPIAGTRKRGIVDNKIDSDLDAKYELELKTNEKEIAEHIMLVDLARNDIARISEPGTREVDELFVAEKYSHVQHLVSNVYGTLRKDLDALHAYVACMNMGTLTGAPKPKAMELIRKQEKTKRNLYGGSVAYLSPDGDFDSTIIIRAMQIKGNKAYIRSGAGIVYNSIPEEEYMESINKAMSCIAAIEKAGGVEYENKDNID